MDKSKSLVENYRYDILLEKPVNVTQNLVVDLQNRILAVFSGYPEHSEPADDDELTGYN